MLGSHPGFKQLFICFLLDFIQRDKVDVSMAEPHYEKIEDARESLDQGLLDVPRRRGRSTIVFKPSLSSGPQWVWFLHGLLLFCYITAAVLFLKTRPSNLESFESLEYGLASRPILIYAKAD